MNFNKCISAKNRLQNGNLSEIHLCVDGKVKTKAETANYSTAIRAVSVPGETVLERWAEKSHLSEEKAEGGKALYWGSSVEAAVCSKQGKYRWGGGEGRGGPRATLCKSRDCLLRKPWNMWQVIRAEERIWQLSWCSDQHRKM